jgi:3-hydroxyisobutyrate dehydrogenase
MTVGYVGLGAMGRALAGNLVGKQDLMVWDLNPRAIEDFVARGARAATSLADLGAQCDLVILCLPKSENVEQALFGADGLAAHLASGAVIVDQTSGVPAASRSFAARLAPAGITLIDAPVAGGVPSALAGQITIMASGKAEAFERVQPVLAAISPKVFRCSGQVGDGQAVKAINNMVNAGYRMATLELLAMGRRLGLTAAAITDALNAGDGRSFISFRLLPAIVAGTSSTDFAMSLMVKDLNQAAELGMAARAAMPISDAARGLMHIALNVLGPDSRLDDVVSFMERLTGTTFIGEAPLPDAVPMAPDEAMALVTGAVAACNRAIMAESIALATRAGLDVAGFAPVINAGSASSRQAEQMFASLQGGPAMGEEKGALEVLTLMARLGAGLGVPLLMTNQARAHYLARADANETLELAGAA